MVWLAIVPRLRYRWAPVSVKGGFTPARGSTFNAPGVAGSRHRRCLSDQAPTSTVKGSVRSRRAVSCCLSPRRNAFPMSCRWSQITRADSGIRRRANRLTATRPTIQFQTPTTTLPAPIERWNHEIRRNESVGMQIALLESGRDCSAEIGRNRIGCMVEKHLFTQR